MSAPSSLRRPLCALVLLAMASGSAAADESERARASNVAVLFGIHHADVPVLGVRYGRAVHETIRVTAEAASFFRLIDRLQLGVELRPLGAASRFDPYVFTRAGAYYQRDDGAGFDDTLAPMVTVGVGLSVGLGRRWVLFADVGADAIGPDYAGDNDRDWSWRVVVSGIAHAGIALRF